MKDLIVLVADKNQWPPGQAKPTDPKVALEMALREARKPRSSAIYLDLAQKVSLRGQSEPAFLLFMQTLQSWFSP